MRGARPATFLFDRAVFPVCDGPRELSAAMANAPELIADRAEALARLWRAARGRP